MRNMGHQIPTLWRVFQLRRCDSSVMDDGGVSGGCLKNKINISKRAYDLSVYRIVGCFLLIYIVIAEKFILIILDCDKYSHNMCIIQT